jgi:peroxiredoxin Q/BCP
MRRRSVPLAFALLLPLVGAAGDPPASRPVAPPTVGERAPDFSLDTLDGKPVRLSELCKSGPVVVVELRGWVGYQCPICTRQVGDLIVHAKDLKQAGATVVLVYPGPADQLATHAQDFIAGKGLPDTFRFVIDPGMKFVDAWHLRWDAPRETAYPATFVVDGAGFVTFAKVSHTHAGRATAAQVLAALPPKP